MLLGGAKTAMREMRRSVWCVASLRDFVTEPASATGYAHTSCFAAASLCTQFRWAQTARCIRHRGQTARKKRRSAEDFPFESSHPRNPQSSSCGRALGKTSEAPRRLTSSHEWGGETPRGSSHQHRSAGPERSPGGWRRGQTVPIRRALIAFPGGDANLISATTPSPSGAADVPARFRRRYGSQPFPTTSL
ncbi:hypothetical protein HPB51_017036 [Rhipicephalus microplus]|uniref:Uncharacterized protein n=1 Tax=Rhipicephalus microplus TaxID=6941 RepID=A0A9J6F528_RHIMP|nr:hypothetical protein HPB51_017036 [Rhipicephalus microplus]